MRPLSASPARTALPAAHFETQRWHHYVRDGAPVHRLYLCKHPCHTRKNTMSSFGCGEAGKYLAWTLAKKGMRVVVIERKYIGGSCPNVACMPSKNIIHSAKVAS